MPFDREPDLDNANVGISDKSELREKADSTEAIKLAASFFV